MSQIFRFTLRYCRLFNSEQTLNLTKSYVNPPHVTAGGLQAREAEKVARMTGR